jgi:hypothetical protein
MDGVADCNVTSIVGALNERCYLIIRQWHTLIVLTNTASPPLIEEYGDSHHECCCSDCNPMLVMSLLSNARTVFCMVFVVQF